MNNYNDEWLKHIAELKLHPIEPKDDIVFDPPKPTIEELQKELDALKQEVERLKEVKVCKWTGGTNIGSAWRTEYGKYSLIRYPFYPHCGGKVE